MRDINDIEDSHFELSTGRRFYANGNIVGIDPDLNLSGGYDNGLDTEYGGYTSGEEGPTFGPWTIAEKVELADYMIALWTRYRALALSGDLASGVSE
jgi:hypothetical protein